jgi:hypothetical protein
VRVLRNALAGLRGEEFSTPTVLSDRDPIEQSFHKLKKSCGRLWKHVENTSTKKSGDDSTLKSAPVALLSSLRKTISRTESYQGRYCPHLIHGTVGVITFSRKIRR